MLGMLGCGKEKPDYESFRVMFKKMSHKMHEHDPIGMTHDYKLVTLPDGDESTCLPLQWYRQCAGTTFNHHTRDCPHTS